MSGRRIAAGAAVLMTALAITPLAAQATPIAAEKTPAVAQKSCGFYVPYWPAPPFSEAWYNHCTSDGSHVVILVERTFGKPYEKCVGPGKTKLGSRVDIMGAKYANKLCKG